MKIAMRTKLYFLNGITFQDVLAALKDFCDYVPNPNGAPLGEEPTQYSHFDEAGCKGWGTFSGLGERQRFSISGASLRREIFHHDRSLCARWNPEANTLIHVVYLSFSDYELFPVWGSSWEDIQPAAPKVYQVYKDLFVKFRADEAQAFSEHDSVLFHWVRASNYQSVMRPYESGREMTEEEALDWRWRDILPTEEVFPEITAEYEAKYKEMLDLKVDW